MAHSPSRSTLGHKDKKCEIEFNLLLIQLFLSIKQFYNITYASSWIFVHEFLKCKHNQYNTWKCIVKNEFVLFWVTSPSITYLFSLQDLVDYNNNCWKNELGFNMKLLLYKQILFHWPFVPSSSEYYLARKKLFNGNTLNLVLKLITLPHLLV